MKILFTGFSARECGVAKKPLDRFDMNAPLVEACRAVGDVDQRVVIVGEDLRGYDLMVICLNQALSFNTRVGVLGALWAAAHDVPTLIWVNDWQVKSAMSHLRTLLKHPHYLDKTIASGSKRVRMFAEFDSTFAPQVLYGAQRFTSPWPSSWRAVLPAFTWGDHTQFEDLLPMAPGQYACSDFSPLGAELVTTPPLPSRRRLAWLLPSLSPQDKWAEKQKVGWPIEYLGSRKLKAERTDEQGVLDRMNETGLVLSPEYPQLMGSGWWRVRYNYAAMTHSLIAGSPDEASPCHSSFNHTPADVEGMDTTRRWEVVCEQKAAMDAACWTADMTRQHLRDVVRWAADS